MMATLVRILAWTVASLAMPLAALGGEPAAGHLLRRTSWVCFEVAGGRITVPSLASAPNRTFSHDGGNVHESLTLNTAGDAPTLSYRYQSSQRELTVEYHGNDAFSLRDVTGGDEAAVEQTASGICLRRQRHNAAMSESRAASLWHLLLFSPEAAEQLIPRLSVLNSVWRLDEQTAAIRELLCRPTHSQWLEERAHWQQCASELGSSDFVGRRSAERALRSGGSAAAGFLKAMVGDDLEVEQRRRIQQIVGEANLRRDEPSAVAAAMRYDANVWWSLMHDEQQEVRRNSAEHLSQLLGRPLTFDPVADAKTRADQLKRIRETLLK